MIAGDGWAVVDRTAETVFRPPTAVVRGYTVVHGGRDLSAAVRAAGIVPVDDETADPVDVDGPACGSGTGYWLAAPFPRSVAPLLDDSRVADLATDTAGYREELFRATRSVE